MDAAPTTASPSAPASAPTPAAPASTPGGSNVPVPANPVAPAPATPAPTEAQKVEAAKRKYKLKVDGQEREEELDDTEVSIRLQKALAAEKRMAEAADVRKTFAKLQEDLKRDPFSVLKDPAFGLDLEQLAEQRLAEKYAAEMMNEEQRKQYQLQKELERYKQDDEARKQKEAQAHQTALEERLYEETEKTFITALEKQGLPKDYQTLAMMAEIARANIEFGIELSPEQMAIEVRGRLSKFADPLKKLRGDALIKELGEEAVKSILEAKVNALKATAPKPFEEKKPMFVADPDSTPKRKPMTANDWRKFVKG